MRSLVFAAALTAQAALGATPFVEQIDCSFNGRIGEGFFTVHFDDEDPRAAGLKVATLRLGPADFLHSVHDLAIAETEDQLEVTFELPGWT